MKEVTHALFYKDVTRIYDGVPRIIGKLMGKTENLTELTLPKDLYFDITSIDIFHANFKETGVLDLQKFPNLKNLRLLEARDLDLFFALHSSESLSELIITSTKYDLVIEFNRSSFPNLKRLELSTFKKLFLKNNTGFFKKDIIEVSIHASDIKGLEVLAEDFSNLKKLSIYTRLSKFNSYLLNNCIIKEPLECLSVINPLSPLNTLQELEIPHGLLYLKELELGGVIIKNLGESLKGMFSLETLQVSKCVTEEHITMQNLSRLSSFKFSNTKGFRFISLNNLPSLRNAFIDADSVLNRINIPKSAEITYIEKYFKKDGKGTLSCEEWVETYGAFMSIHDF